MMLAVFFLGDLQQKCICAAGGFPSSSLKHFVPNSVIGLVFTQEPVPKAKSKRRAKAAGSGSNKRTKTEDTKAGQSLANFTLVGIVVTPSFAAWSDTSFFWEAV